MRSDQIKQGIERMPNRALLYGTGITANQMSKPFIGLCSSFTDLIPGHVGMRALERKIEWGIAAGSSGRSRPRGHGDRLRVGFQFYARAGLVNGTSGAAPPAPPSIPAAES